MRGIDLVFTFAGTLCKAFDEGKGLGGVLDVDDAVEAGIADDGSLFDADGGKEFDAFVVLNEEVAYLPQ